MTSVSIRFDRSDLERLLQEKYDTNYLDVYHSCVSDNHIISMLIGDDEGISLKFSLHIPYSITASNRSKAEYLYNETLYKLFGNCVHKIDKALKWVLSVFFYFFLVMFRYIYMNIYEYIYGYIYGYIYIYTIPLVS